MSMNVREKPTTALLKPTARTWMGHFSARVNRDLWEMEKHATVGLNTLIVCLLGCVFYTFRVKLATYLTIGNKCLKVFEICRYKSTRIEGEITLE